MWSLGANIRYRVGRKPKFPGPVICVGNVVLGGSGKTPTVMALISLLKKRGHQPHIVSRGYGRSIKVQCQRVTFQNTPHEIGDEPFLLSKHAPVWVGDDRQQSIHQAFENGATIVISDDGFQNPLLDQTFKILVIDGWQLLGNNHVFPSGPLREPFIKAADRADLILFVRHQAQQPSHHNWLNPYTEKVITSTLVCDPVPDLADNYFAFCGIGFPQKFYRTLQSLGLKVIHYHDFPDHYRYSPQDIIQVKEKASIYQAQLITTEKDHIKIPDNMKKDILFLPIKMVFDDAVMLSHKLEPYLQSNIRVLT